MTHTFNNNDGNPHVESIAESLIIKTFKMYLPTIDPLIEQDQWMIMRTNSSYTSITQIIINQLHLVLLPYFKLFH